MSSAAFRDLAPGSPFISGLNANASAERTQDRGSIVVAIDMPWTMPFRMLFSRSTSQELSSVLYANSVWLEHIATQLLLTTSGYSGAEATVAAAVFGLSLIAENFPSSVNYDLVGYPNDAVVPTYSQTAPNANFRECPEFS